MTIRPPLIALCTVLVGCGAGRPIQQTTVTQLREQDALVMAPEVPMGFGASLPAGSASLSFGGGFTSSLQPGAGQPGQHVLPLSALARASTAAGERLELGVSGSLASPDVELGPLSPGVDRLSGVLARGTMGMRTFLPLDGLVQWGWSFDLGAEATHLSRTDTTTVEVRDRQGTETTQESTTFYDLRIHPHTRVGTVVRAPTPLGFTAILGAQLQTWPSYWASKTQTDTCTRWRFGGEECVKDGSIKGAPSRFVGVFTPTVGGTVDAGGTAIHVQAFANVGDDAVAVVPWGAMVMVERVFPPAPPP